MKWRLSLQSIPAEANVWSNIFANIMSVLFEAESTNVFDLLRNKHWYQSRDVWTRMVVAQKWDWVYFLHYFDWKEIVQTHTHTKKAATRCSVGAPLLNFQLNQLCQPFWPTFIDLSVCSDSTTWIQNLNTANTQVIHEMTIRDRELTMHLQSSIEWTSAKLTWFRFQKSQK